MGPYVMTACIAVALAVFGWSAHRRWLLMRAAAAENRFDRLGTRLGRMIWFALMQRKLPKYPVMGLIHMAIFWGFLVLLINTLILWGRGFDEHFVLWIFGDNWLGDLYRFFKDIFAVAVLVAAGLALLNRVILKPSRLTASFEAALILLIIVVMMIGDLAYWGWQLSSEGISGFHVSEPFVSLFAAGFSRMDPATVEILGTIGFWSHAVLVLVFLNILPYGKHFHVITSLPNVFFSNLEVPGKLPRDENIEKVLAEEEEEDEEEEPVFGVDEVQHFSWKDVLDMYSCTECGRCTDNCPAAESGKPLQPKQLLTAVRDHLYSRQREMISGEIESRPLVPDVIDPEVIWSCTTCRACEEECPLLITYVDKLVRMRRDLVEGRGEPPAELATALRGMETNANPWNISPMDRDDWTEGLEVPEFDSDSCEYLLFVGCAASFDDRARKIARALVSLLDAAGVSYGYLGAEEPCCGDIARRGGSEANFRMMAEMTVETLKELGVEKIITPCPHGYNTLKHEYPELGGEWEVLHHSELLAELLDEGKLRPEQRVEQRMVFHDACYLGRYNEMYEAPRRILEAVPGLELVEIDAGRKRAMCCGAGGARYFMEEAPDQRVNSRRLDQLLEPGPKSIASACPFCMTMLSDGLKERDLYDSTGQLDVAEILAISCGKGDRKLLREQSEPAEAE
jgi:Fe-S oxidoreductase/nitrate reductase gamma subunit